MDPASLNAAAGKPGWVPLIDVSELSVTELIDGADTVFAQVIRQVVQSLDDPNGVISAFQSFAAP